MFEAAEVSRPSARSPLRALRPPTLAERAAARRLARALRSAGHRERVVTTTASRMPPGRLRMREALAADAQRAADALPTAEPFVRTIHRSVSSPPLRVGIACDVSGSMSELAGPIASAAWIVARAAAHVPDARSATVLFGMAVHALTYPGAVPARVQELAAEDPTQEFPDAVDALDAALGLSRPGAARLLVVVSDGRFTVGQRTHGQERVTRLLRSGCAALWLGLDGRTRPLEGVQTVFLASPADAADAIGKAAVRALAAAG